MIARRNRRRSSVLNPSWSRRSSRSPDAISSFSRIRITTASPKALGRMETRKSTFLRSTRILNRPSCGIRRSAMSSSDMTLTREIRGACNLIPRGSIAG